MFTFIFAVLFGRREPWASIAVFFLVLLLATWGIGRYIRFMGPPVFGIYWLPFFLIALLFSFLLAAALPARPPRTTEELEHRTEKEEQARVALDTFFWLFVVVLVVLIAVSYAVPGLVY